MTKELQDFAWSRLPKEFKEEVKKEYNHYAHYGIYEERMWAYIEIFGQDNLTSDAEGEEMLTVEKSRVQQQYNRANQLQGDSDPKWNLVGDQIARVLSGLFGSKCLPDDVSVDSLKVREFININELDVDKFVKSEPRFTAGDVAVISSEFKHPLLEQGGAIVTILSYHPNGDFYSCAIAPNVGIDVDAKYLEPYTEPKENIAESRKTSQNCDKEFDNILKDSFSKERRLNIAAMIMAAMMQNAKWGDKYSHIATISCAAADALIIEVEKTNNPLKNK